MNRNEQTEMFKAAVDSINIMFELSGEEIPLAIRKGKDDSILYCRICQKIKKGRIIEYFIEYRIGFEVVSLEIHYPLKIHASLLKKVKEHISFNSINFEQSKATGIFKFFYRFDDLDKLTTIGLLMMDLNKGRKN